MVKTEKRALRMLRQGAIIRRASVGMKIGFEGNFSSGGSWESIHPRLVGELEEAGRIRRTDDQTSVVGQEWAVAKYAIDGPDLIALRDVVAYAKEALKDGGGCDHSVGICECDTIRALEQLERSFPIVETKEVK